MADGGVRQSTAVTRLPEVGDTRLDPTRPDHQTAKTTLGVGMPIPDAVLNILSSYDSPTVLFFLTGSGGGDGGFNNQDSGGFGGGRRGGRGTIQ